MNSFSIKNSIRFGVRQYKQWIGNPKNIIILLEILFIWTYISNNLKGMCSDMGTNINIFEPVVAVFNSKIMSMIIPVTYLVLMIEYPQANKASIFMIHRIGKINWVCGQIFFFVLSIITYLAILVFVTIIPMITLCDFNNEWSDTITKYTLYFPKKSMSIQAHLIDDKLFSQMAPAGAAIHSIVLNGVFLIIISNLLLLLFVVNKKVWGGIVAAGVIGLGEVLCAIASKWMWFLPTPHTLLYLHFQSYLRKRVFEIYASYIYLGAAILIISVIIFLRVKHINFLQISEEE